jgi:hypothetical protein
LHYTKRVVVITGNYVAGVIWNDFRAHPDKDSVFCDLGGHDAAFQARYCPSHPWSVFPMEPPTLFHSLAIVRVSQGLNVLSDVFKWKFVKGGFGFGQRNKVDYPALLFALHDVSTYESSLYNVRVRSTVRVQRHGEHFLGLRSGEVKRPTLHHAKKAKTCVFWKGNGTRDVRAGG